MLEVELKAALTPEQTAGLPDRLEAMGFANSALLQETDLYWNGGGRDFRETDEALRLRRVADLRTQKAENLLTYKGPRRDSRSNTRLEHETSVGSMETARQLLEALGYQAAYIVEKRRREFTREGITVCLDQVAGLGNYLELEILLRDGMDRDAAIDRLLALLDSLGVSREALCRRSYLELLIAADTVRKSS